VNRPQFIRDAHAHPFQHGRSLDMVDLAGCESPGGMLDALAGAASGTDDPSSPLLAHGARPESWDPPAWPTLNELDRVTGDRPCCVWCFDHHALMANSVMLGLAGVGTGTSDPAHGHFERDTHGRLTGVALEHAAMLVWNAIPQPGHDERRRIVRRAVADLNLAHGFAEVHDLKAPAWLGPILAEVLAEEANRDLDARYVLFPLLDDLDEVLATRDQWESERVRLGGAKVFVDGTLNSRTAWMLRPFADPLPGHPCGTPMMTPGQIEEAVRRCDERGVPLAAHAIGDGAVRAVLDAIERVGPKASGFRIEHAEVVDEADIARFAKLGVIASVQPCHLLADMDVLYRVLPDRLGRVMPLREMIDEGTKPGELLLFGSDTPIVRPNPQDSIRAATARRRVGMKPEESIASEQAISEAEAWAAFACAS
jgi:predicted amidohydrolase YtcJ